MVTVPFVIVHDVGGYIISIVLILPICMAIDGKARGPTMLPWAVKDDEKNH